MGSSGSTEKETVTSSGGAQAGSPVSVPSLPSVGPTLVVSSPVVPSRVVTSAVVTSANVAGPEASPRDVLEPVEPAEAEPVPSPSSLAEGPQPPASHAIVQPKARTR